MVYRFRIRQPKISNEALIFVVIDKINEGRKGLCLWLKFEASFIKKIYM